MSDAGSEPRPFGIDEGAGKQYAPAAARNREPIAAVLAKVLPPSGLVLEVASGTGEHAVHFAQAFPGIDWQPSDPSPAALVSIAAWRRDAGLANLQVPVELDASASEWPVAQADAMFCANMTHIAPWEATKGLFAGAGRVLACGGRLVIYGPFVEAEVATAPSNLAFDRSLRQRDPSWGLREVADLDRLAELAGLVREQRIAMPANNLMLVYRRT